MRGLGGGSGSGGRGRHGGLGGWEIWDRGLGIGDGGLEIDGIGTRDGEWGLGSGC